MTTKVLNNYLTDADGKLKEKLNAYFCQDEISTFDMIFVSQNGVPDLENEQLYVQ